MEAFDFEVILKGSRRSLKLRAKSYDFKETSGHGLVQFTDESGAVIATLALDQLTGIITSGARASRGTAL